jgi:hypothetical protein
MDAPLNPAGLSNVAHTHEANDAYPGQTYADFADEYDPATSEYPWDTAGTCCVCGRIAQRRDPAISAEVSRYDPHRNQVLWSVVCSPVCALRFGQRLHDQQQQQQQHFAQPQPNI